MVTAQYALKQFVRCGLVFGVAVVCGLVSTASVSAEETKPAEPKINYEEHIKPIFRENCFFCHGQDDAKSDLALDSYGRVMQGGAGGAIVAPGDPDGSRLWKLVAHEETPEMPPESDKLPDDQLALIRKWIELGALETPTSKAKLPKKQMVDLTVTAGSGKPEGPAAMPEGLSRQPVIYTPSTTAVTALAASPWAPLVAVAGQNQISLYNSDTAELLGVLPYPEGVAHVMRFSRNGSLLLAGGGHAAKSGKVVVFDVVTGNRVIEVGDELDAVLAADISEDQSLIALGGPSKVVRVYATADGSLVYDVRKHTDWVYDVEFSPDGVLLTTADRSGGMFVWEAETGREYANFKGHGGAITSVSWRIDSNVLASASEDGTVRLWEMNNPRQIKSWNAHGGGASHVRFTHDGRLVSAGRDKHVKVWDQNGKQLIALGPMNDITLEAVFTHDGKRVVGGDWTGDIRLWNVEDGAEVAKLPQNPPTLDMVAKATAAEAEAREAEARQLAEALAAAEKKLADANAAATAAANKAGEAQKAVATAEQARTDAMKLAEAKTQAAKKAAEQLAAAQAAAKKAQEELVASQEAVKKLTADIEQLAKVSADSKASAEQLAAQRATVEQELAAARAAAEQAAQRAQAARAAAERAAAENAALQQDAAQANAAP